jgi:hypothetical protein
MWQIRDGWLVLVNDLDMSSLTLLIPPSWAEPILIDTVYTPEDDDDSA